MAPSPVAFRVAGKRADSVPVIAGTGLSGSTAVHSRDVTLPSGYRVFLLPERRLQPPPHTAFGFRLFLYGQYYLLFFLTNLANKSMEDVIDVVTVCSRGLEKWTAELSRQRQPLFLGDLQRHKHEKTYSARQAAVTAGFLSWTGLPAGEGPAVNTAPGGLQITGFYFQCTY